MEKSKGELQISGTPENIASALDRVYELLRDVDREKHSEQEAELIADIVKWCFIDRTKTGDKLEVYPPHINRLLEKAYKRQEQKVSFKDNSGNTYCVDLDYFEVYSEQNPKTRMKVLRKSKIEGLILYIMRKEQLCYTIVIKLLDVLF